MRSQVNALRQRPEIVVGCPGRVLDLLQQRVLRLGRVETLVLDEADHMFDMGFLPDIRRDPRGAYPAAPAESAVLGHHAEGESAGWPTICLTNPHVVELADMLRRLATVDHALYMVAEPRKRDLLERTCSPSDECDSAIVFIRTKHPRTAPGRAAQQGRIPCRGTPGQPVPVPA